MVALSVVIEELSVHLTDLLRDRPLIHINLNLLLTGIEGRFRSIFLNPLLVLSASFASSPFALVSLTALMRRSLLRLSLLNNRLRRGLRSGGRVLSFTLVEGLELFLSLSVSHFFAFFRSNLLRSWEILVTNLLSDTGDLACVPELLASLLLFSCEVGLETRLGVLDEGAVLLSRVLLVHESVLLEFFQVY